MQIRKTHNVDYELNGIKQAVSEHKQAQEQGIICSARTQRAYNFESTLIQRHDVEYRDQTWFSMH